MTQVVAPKPLKQLGSFFRGAFTFVFMSVWTTGWLVGTVAVDLSVWRTFSRAAVALGYQTTEGKVIRIDATPRTNSKGVTYNTYQMAYGYEVDGRAYESTRDHVPDDWVDSHAIGDTVRVFYDPHQPATAALETHVTTGDLMLSLIAIVFNGVAIGVVLLWGIFVGWILSILFRPAAGEHVGMGGRGLTFVIKAIMRPWAFRWLYVLLASAAASILVIGILAGRGVLRVIPLAIWTLILAWLVSRLLRPWPRQGERFG